MSKHFQEPSKIAIRRSRIIAILRGLAIHTVPLGLSLFEVVLNWRGYFYGSEFNRLAYYQIGAKVHEISIQASLAMIVLSSIRREIALGEGIPFGVFLGGIQFVQPSYLWSTELWSSITAKDFHVRRKIVLLALLLLSGILALTAGPSSATLLVPRQIIWSLPPSHFAINGTFQDVWPDRMEQDLVPVECGTLSYDDQTTLCPGGLWLDLSQTFPTESAYDNEDRTSSTEQFDLFPDPVWPLSKIFISQLCGSSARDQVCASAPQDIAIAGAWNDVHNHKALYDFPKSTVDETHSLNTDYFQPYVAAVCVPDMITVENKEEPLRFARISETESEYEQDKVLVSVPEYPKSKAVEAPGNRSEFRLQWLDLQESLFNDQVIGAIILNPVESPNSPLNITTCTLSAGWGTSSAALDQRNTNTFWTTITGVPRTWPVMNKTPVYALQSIPDYGNFSDYVYP